MTGSVGPASATGHCLLSLRMHQQPSGNDRDSITALSRGAGSGAPGPAIWGAPCAELVAFFGDTVPGPLWTADPAATSRWRDVPPALLGDRAE